ncbi:MAG TPA: hypothetical protein VM346_03300 [Sphingomicrobium sp.]|nr:hypothetical protein [Sphingomicrobium sp.]
MRLLIAAAPAIAGAAFAAAHAQPLPAPAAERSSLLEPVGVIAPKARGFTLPSSTEIHQTGSVARRNGLIAGVDVAPNAVIGLGFFRMRTRQVPGDDTEPRMKSRKVAVGVKLGF